MSGEFTTPGDQPVDPQRIVVGTGVGLALIADDDVHYLTGGRLRPPAAVLLVEGATAFGPVNAQILSASDMLAALHGALDAWRTRLPVAVRDQYDACRTEAAHRWTEQVEARFGPTAGGA